MVQNDRKSENHWLVAIMGTVLQLFLGVATAWGGVNLPKFGPKSIV